MDNSGYHKIDDYLLGRLEGKELEAFEQQLQSDMAFAKTVDQQRQAMHLLQKVADLEMKKEVQKVQDLYQAKKPAKHFFRVLRPWIAAAAILLFIVVSYWALQGTTNDKLFKNYYTAYNTSFGDRDGNDPLEIKLAEASKYYQQKDYAQALPIFESAQEEMESAKLDLMTGVSYLEIQQFDKAQKSFQQLIDEKDPVFQYHGLWYSAMAFLRSDDIENAKAQLQKLVNATDPNGVYKQAEARTLLKKL